MGAAYSMRYWRRKKQAVNRLSCPICLVKEAEPKPTSYSAACSSRHSGVWTEATQAEFDGIEAAATFAEILKFQRVL